MRRAAGGHGGCRVHVFVDLGMGGQRARETLALGCPVGDHERVATRGTLGGLPSGPREHQCAGRLAGHRLRIVSVGDKRIYRAISPRQAGDTGEDLDRTMSDALLDPRRLPTTITPQTLGWNGATRRVEAGNGLGAGHRPRRWPDPT